MSIVIGDVTAYPPWRTGWTSWISTIWSNVSDMFPKYHRPYWVRCNNDFEIFTFLVQYVRGRNREFDSGGNVGWSKGLTLLYQILHQLNQDFLQSTNQMSRTIRYRQMIHKRLAFAHNSETTRQEASGTFEAPTRNALASPNNGDIWQRSFIYFRRRWGGSFQCVPRAELDVPNNVMDIQIKHDFRDMGTILQARAIRYSMLCNSRKSNSLFLKSVQSLLLHSFLIDGWSTCSENARTRFFIEDHLKWSRGKEVHDIYSNKIVRNCFRDRTVRRELQVVQYNHHR